VQSSCAQSKVKSVESNQAEIMSQFGSGKAEISVYELKQNRYDGLHQGNVTCVWVTEPFLMDKQVKNESNTSKNSTTVLKNIRLKKFTTGIYDYTISTSVFTPIDRNQFPHSPKVSNTSLEWCGQTFLQLNLKGDHYESKLFSYFEQEGDKESKVEAALLEDEIFTLIRMNPELLPQGQIELIPSLSYLRLMHVDQKGSKAMAKIKKYSGDEFKGNNLQVYEVNFLQLNRNLKIIYEAAFPHKILGWEDRYPSVSDREMRTTVATLSKTKMVDYWNKKGKEGEELRIELGL